jgi:hypothetical protein
MLDTVFLHSLHWQGFFTSWSRTVRSGVSVRSAPTPYTRNITESLMCGAWKATCSSRCGVRLGGMPVAGRTLLCGLCSFRRWTGSLTGKRGSLLAWLVRCCVCLVVARDRSILNKVRTLIDMSYGGEKRASH